jgi:hypothetical protein
MRKNNRFLANYLSLRFKRSVKGATEKELEKFLDENGWILYDMESMVQNFVEWRKKEAIQKPTILTM